MLSILCVPALFWTAPEILLDVNHPRNGSPKGDVYSFAIILQEIIYRCGPYETTGSLLMVPKGKVHYSLYIA